MSLLTELKNRLRKEAFLTTPLDIVASSIYIIRNGLYINIRDTASNIAGIVLDFGCGSKPYESLFVNAKKYIGIDVEVSGHNHKDSKVDVFYDGKTLPFADKSFDAVVCFEVLEHIFNPDEAITEIRRVLKGDGKILISIPFAFDEHEVPFDFARYTSYGVRDILQRNGFEVVELKKTTTYVLAVFQMLIAYVAQYVSPKGRVTSTIFQLAIIFPLNVLAIALNAVLPKRYEYFCNCVVLAKVTSTPLQP